MLIVLNLQHTPPASQVIGSSSEEYQGLHAPSASSLPRVERFRFAGTNEPLCKTLMRFATNGDPAGSIGLQPAKDHRTGRGALKGSVEVPAGF